MLHSQKTDNLHIKLRAVIAEQKLMIGDQAKAIEHKDTIISQLEERIQLLSILKFGRSSEKYVLDNDLQMSLFDEDELAGCYVNPDELEDEEEPDQKGTEVAGHTRKNKGKRKPLPDCLPRVRMEYQLPKEELVGPNGEIYTKIGEDISEQVDIIPQQVQVTQHARFKYAVANHEELGVKIAPMPNQVIPKSIASPGLLAHIAQSKYQYHLPLYRQEEIWKSLDIHLPRNSICRWMLRVGELVAPLIEYQLEEMKLHNHMHIDETTVTVVKDSNKKADASSHKGYMWAYVNALGVVYDYQSSRSGSILPIMLENFEGTAQSDAFSGYSILGKTDRITSVGCFAHATKAAGKNKASPTADKAIKIIAKLYKIEKHIKDNGFNTNERYKYRQKYSIPILKELYDFLIEKKPKVPPKSLIGKAINYSLNNWQALYAYTSSGLTSIDNNAAERAIKPFVIGRKNWLFCGNTRSAKAAANIYSLIESAKIHNLKVFDYLKFVFENIQDADTPRKLEQLLPVYACDKLPKMSDP